MNVDNFIDQYYPLAEKVGRVLDVSPTAVLSQWALETGYGKSVIPGTNNLGNIKTFKGEGVKATDNATGSQDMYRKYDSPEAFGDDYMDLVIGKYKRAIGAKDDVAKFAQELHKAGYAEDPQYAAKVVQVSNVIGDAIKRRESGDVDIGAILGYQKPDAQPSGGEEDIGAILGYQKPEAQQSEQPSPMRIEINGVSDQPAPAQPAPAQPAPAQPAPVESRGATGGWEPTPAQPTAETPSDSEQTILPDFISKSPVGDFIRGGREGFRNMVRGANQIRNDLTGFALRNSPTLQSAYNAMPSLISAGGLAATPQEAEQRNREIYAQTLAGQKNTESIAGKAGELAANIVATAVPASRISSVAGLAGLGGVSSALQPTETTGDRFVNTALGAVLSGGAGAVANRFAPTKEGQEILKQGGKGTLAQLTGRGAQEQKLTSLNGVGETVARAREAGLRSFSKKALEKAVPPGHTVDMTGKEVPEILEATSQAFTKAYGTITKGHNIKMDPVGKRFIIDGVKNTEDAIRPQDIKIVVDYLNKQFTMFGDKAEVPAASMQKFQQALTRQATRYLNSQDPNHQAIGKLFLDASGRVAAWWQGKLPPEVQKLLAPTNAAYRNFVRIQEAVARKAAGGSDMFFTPEQLSQALKKADISRHKADWAAGKLPMQDLVNPALKVYGSKVADSGTAGRLAAQLPMVGLGSGTAMLGSILSGKDVSAEDLLIGALAGGAAGHVAGKLRSIPTSVAYSPQMQKLLTDPKTLALASALRSTIPGAASVAAKDFEEKAFKDKSKQNRNK